MGNAEHQRLEHLRDARGSAHDVVVCLRRAGDTGGLQLALAHWAQLMEAALAQAECAAGECDGGCPADVEVREGAAADADYVAGAGAGGGR